MKILCSVSLLFLCGCIPGLTGQWRGGSLDNMQILEKIEEIPDTRFAKEGGEKDMLWFTADSHFGHDALLDHEDVNFDTVVDRDNLIIDNWNKVVDPHDEVWHLGDFAFRNTEDQAQDYLRALNGRIHLIRGNHDDRGAWKIRNLFKSAHEAKYLRWGGEKIYLSHYPMVSWRNSHQGSWHLHGHHHGDYTHPGRAMDVGIMLHGYRPLSFDEVEAYVQDRPITQHHLNPYYEDDE